MEILNAPGLFNPQQLTDVNGTLFFTAQNGGVGNELWKSDGTLAGTKLVKDIFAGSGNAYPRYLTNYQGTLYFQAWDGSKHALWKSDGTEQGTTLVRDAQGNVVSGGDDLAVVNEVLYFDGYTSAAGIELWRTDGTPGGTRLVRDVRQGSTTSEPEQFTAANGLLFFTADDGVHGVELWKSDGTAEGTALVKDIQPIGVDESPGDLIGVNGWLFFDAYDGDDRKLWQTDGTEDGTRRVQDFSGAEFRTDLTRDPTVNVGGTLFFNGWQATGAELYRSNGTPAGTVLVRDIHLGSFSSMPEELTDVDGTLFFKAYDGLLAIELWKSDGTPNGTELVKDIWTGGGYGNPDDLTNVDGLLYFTANDGAHGRELWQSDGTADGTTLVKDLRPGIEGTSFGELIASRGNLFFVADNFSTDDGFYGEALYVVRGAPTNAPLGVEDQYVLGTSSGTSQAAAGVLTNDQSLGGTPSSVRTVNASFGTLVLNSGGTFSYTPGPNFHGYDSFQYRPSDGANNGNETIVELFSHTGALVAKAYQAVLGRPFDLGGLEYWVQKIEAGEGLSAFAIGVFESRERLEPIIRSYYRNYLGRTQDPSQEEIDFYYDRWRNEGGPQFIEPDFFASPEFYANQGGGTDQGWVAALYQIIVGRIGTQPEIDFHLNRLQNLGVTRQGIVAGFLYAPENLEQTIRSLYSQILSREPTAAELAAQIASMAISNANPKTQKQLQLELLDSAEFSSVPAKPAAGQAVRF